jgi:hypothetical protein
MCRNIRVLSHFDPPTTPAEIHDAALQYVRKVSGLNRPKATEQDAFDEAVAEVAKATRRLLHSIRPTGPKRTREGERAKAKARWAARESSLRQRSSSTP